jgi:hypothetical protein
MLKPRQKIFDSPADSEVSVVNLRNLDMFYAIIGKLSRPLF